MKPRVVAIIKGGLGNQLFAYAAARAFALREGRELLLDDASGFVRDGYGRQFRLNRFPIAADPAPAGVRLGDPKSLRHRMLRTWNKLLPAVSRSYLKELPGHGAAQLASFQPQAEIVHLNGYWQDEACFAGASDTLRRELEPPASGNEALEQELQSGDTVFVHVRRIRYSPRLDADYYQGGISEAAGAFESPRFEVFGDDIDWARERLDFGDHPARFHEPSDDELLDFRLMTRCRHAIVANSSFSWWAAWLQEPDHRVWTPESPGWPLRPAAGWATIANGLKD